MDRSQEPRAAVHAVAVVIIYSILPADQCHYSRECSLQPKEEKTYWHIGHQILGPAPPIDRQRKARQVEAYSHNHGRDESAGSLKCQCVST